MVGAEFVIRHAIQEGVKITLVLNKIDRLILELRIKPADAYYKIKHTIEEVNTFIRCVMFTCVFRWPHVPLIQRYRPEPGTAVEPRKWECCICKYGYELVLYFAVVRADVR